MRKLKRSGDLLTVIQLIISGTRIGPEVLVPILSWEKLGTGFGEDTVH